VSSSRNFSWLSGAAMCQQIGWREVANSAITTDDQHLGFACDLAQLPITLEQGWWYIDHFSGDHVLEL